VLISLVYFVQLTLVAPRMARGEVGGIELLVFVPFNSFLYAVDLLGYSFMSMATLFVAFAFRGDGVERIARGFLFINFSTYSLSPLSFRDRVAILFPISNNWDTLLRLR
jgi:hypothetical protein